jgi:hypothetical protein
VIPILLLLVWCCSQILQLHTYSMKSILISTHPRLLTSYSRASKSIEYSVHIRTPFYTPLHSCSALPFLHIRFCHCGLEPESSLIEHITPPHTPQQTDPEKATMPTPPRQHIITLSLPTQNPKESLHSPVPQSPPKQQHPSPPRPPSLFQARPPQARPAS